MQIDCPTPTNNPSSLQKLITHTQIFTDILHPSYTHANLVLTDELTTITDPDNFIPLTVEEKTRLYSPWRYSIIIKVVGIKVGRQLLKQKVFAQWKSTEDLLLIDLGSDYFLIKFQREENMLRALHDGCWFMLNHFLSVRRWEPKFIVSNTPLTYSTIWERLFELPTEFYDMNILTRVGNKIKKLLKMDNCTS